MYDGEEKTEKPAPDAPELDDRAIPTTTQAPSPERLPASAEDLKPMDAAFLWTMSHWRLVRDVLLLALLAALCLFAFFALGGCATPQAASAWAKADDYRHEMEADGVIEPAELEQYAELVKEAGAASRDSLGGNLWTVLYSLIFGVPASVAATNAYRNRSMPGTHRKTPDAPPDPGT